MTSNESDDPPHRFYPLMSVMDGKGDVGQYLDYTEEVRLVKEEAERNLWNVHVHGDWVTTIDGDDISSSAVLGRFLDRIVEAYEVDGEGEAEAEEDEVPQDQGFDGFGRSSYQ